VYPGRFRLGGRPIRRPDLFLYQTQFRHQGFREDHARPRGVLDRFDSLLFTAPVIELLLIVLTVVK
jgi:hypothetical protein